LAFLLLAITVNLLLNLQFFSKSFSSTPVGIFTKFSSPSYFNVNPYFTKSGQQANFSKKSAGFELRGTFIFFDLK